MTHYRGNFSSFVHLLFTHILIIAIYVAPLSYRA